MAVHFDEVLFVISIDCFTEYIFSGFSLEDVQEVKAAAREEILTILNGGNNYYMRANFSEERKNRSRQEFFTKLKNRNVSSALQEQIRFFEEILDGISDDLITAISEITSVASRFNWLNTDKLTTPITDELLELSAQVEHLGFSSTESTLDWSQIEEIWFNSTSEWDQFLSQEEMFDGITDAPCSMLNKILNFSSQLDFLYRWKEYLGEERYALIRRFIIAESHLEIDSVNPGAAKEIDRIMTLC